MAAGRDRSTPSFEPSRLGGPETPGRYVRVSVALAVTALVGTVVNTSVTVAVAGIAQDLGAPLATTGVAVLLMNVSMAFLMPLAGLAAGRIGARETLVAAGVLVVVSTALLASADSLAMVAVGRLLQGGALAAVLPTVVQASTAILEDRDRARALGWWAAANGVGLAVAPLLGGVLLDLGGWRLVTLPSVALGVAMIASATAAFPPRLRHDAGVPLRGVAALSLLAGTFITFLAALSASAWIVAAAVACALALATIHVGRLVLRTGELDRPARWWRERLVRRTSLGASAQMMANGMAQVTVPARLVSQGRVSSGGAGALLLLMTFTMAAMGPVTGRLSGVPFDRWLLGGLSGCFAGLGVMTLAGGAGPWWLVSAGLPVLGVSAGALLTPSLHGYSVSVAGGDAVGLALFNVLRLGWFAIGGLMGVAAIGLGLPWLAFAIGAVGAGTAALTVARR